MDPISVVPEGYHAVATWIISRRTSDVIDFLVDVFEGVELDRLEKDGAIQHAEVRIGDTIVLLFDSWEGWPQTPVFLRHYVADDTAVLDRARKAGSSVLTEPTELAWGDRVSRFSDPFGNLHWVHQRVAEPDAAELQRRWSSSEFQAAMAYVQSVQFTPAR